jgi:hypothetical protein
MNVVSPPRSNHQSLNIMSSSSPLTQGAIRTMVDSFEGSKVDGYQPTLQVINIKPVQNGNDRFRVCSFDEEDEGGGCVAPLCRVSIPDANPSFSLLVDMW